MNEDISKEIKNQIESTTKFKQLNGKLKVGVFKVVDVPTDVKRELFQATDIKQLEPNDMIVFLKENLSSTVRESFASVAMKAAPIIGKALIWFGPLLYEIIRDLDFSFKGNKVKFRKFKHNGVEYAAAPIQQNSENN